MNVPKRRKLVAALGAAVGLAGCAAFGATESPDDEGDGPTQTSREGPDGSTETPVPTSDRTATPTPRPTATAPSRPTDPPTATPAKTTRPTPTPTSVPTSETATQTEQLDGGGSVVGGSSGGTGGSIGGNAPVTGGSSDDTDGATSTPTPTETPTPTPTDEDGNELDPKEANVLAVEATELYDGRYMFKVTLQHDDAGESGFADWWQVESRDGDRLGRRAFFRGRAGQQPFSSLKRIAVPADEPCIVVRGHDQVHGYGGQAMVLALASGETTPIRQGSSKDSMASVACQGEE